MSPLLQNQNQKSIQKAVVIGAGTMGSGIAAQLANAGVSVYLLDQLPTFSDDTNSSNPAERNALALKAIQRMLKATPATDPLNAGFMHPSFAHRIQPGNLTDDLEKALKDADWIVEAIIEDLGIKQALFARLEKLIKPEAIVSSNTSTMPLQDLTAGHGTAFKSRFLITHFFNPPRFMQLLEIVGGPDTQPEVFKRIRHFGDYAMGKIVLNCKDTPAFLANRIGIYLIFRSVMEALERNLSVAEADAVLSRPIGFPKEGIFGMLDLVGIGIIPLVTNSMIKTLPPEDTFRKLDHGPATALIQRLLAAGCTGRQSPKGGFYRMEKGPDGRKQKQAIHLQSGEYETVPSKKPSVVKIAKQKGLRAFLETSHPLAQYTWVVLRDTLLYAAWLIPEIADDIAELDAALRGGYNAQWGPFELMDQMGVPWFCQRVLGDGLPLPPLLAMARERSMYCTRNGQLYRLMADFKTNQAAYQPLSSYENVLRLSDIKLKSKPLLSHKSASLWDLGDGVTCLEFHSKMNTLDPSILWVLNQTIRLMKQHSEQYRALVIYNEGEQFSLGANLGLIQAGFQTARGSGFRLLGVSGWLETLMTDLTKVLLFQGQQIYHALRYAPFPVIGAPNGMALGGGCEILLHCDRLQANAETYMGLVEVGVGVIPAWGGCIRSLETAQKTAGDNGPHGQMIAPKQTFQTILTPHLSVSTSGFDAQKKNWLSNQDGITMNRLRLLDDAKAMALQMLKEGYQTPSHPTFKLPGAMGKAALSMAIDDFYTKGELTSHDVIVADALATVLTGGDTHAGVALTESDIAQLERESFLSLLAMPATRKRIANTLATGKPFREDIPPATERPAIDDLRGSRPKVHLPNQPLSDGPFEGSAALGLRLFADISAFILRCVGA